MGVLIAIMKKLNKALPRKEFAWKIFFTKNVVPMGLNLITGITLVLSLGITKGTIMFNERDITYLACVFLGFAGNYIFDLLFEAADTKLKTYLGRNHDG
jgi:formate/nitrite transporter FocA (FNT family)